VQITSISLNLNIKPDYLQLTGKGSLQIQKENISERILRLYLNSELDWKKLVIKQGKKSFKLKTTKINLPDDTFLRAATYWEILLPEEIEEKFELTFEYKGSIKIDPWGTNYLTLESVELSIYSAWYPIMNLEDKPPFEVLLKGPEKWLWKMNALLKESNHWSNPKGDNDLTLLGRTIDSAIDYQNGQRFWGSNEHYEKYLPLETKLREIETLLTEWLGPPEKEELVIALTSRETGGMYVRNGLIVTQDVLPDEYFTTKSNLLLLSWTHELCHMWFNKASVKDYHNWIDEALADYCALIITEEFFGEEFYKERLQKVKEMITGELPAIKSITRSNEKAQLIYYNWGSLIIHKIYQEIGKELFKQTVKDFAQKAFTQKETTTDDFVESLEKVTHKDWSEKIDNLLEAKPDLKLIE
jgi:hypothetical protein